MSSFPNPLGGAATPTPTIPGNPDDPGVKAVSDGEATTLRDRPQPMRKPEKARAFIPLSGRARARALPKVRKASAADVVVNRSKPPWSPAWARASCPASWASAWAASSACSWPLYVIAPPNLSLETPNNHRPANTKQMSYDTPYGSPLGAQQGQNPITSLPLRQQLKVGFKDMGTRSYSMARNFGKVGALFSGIECGIEGLRARNDLANGVAAGCLSGGILARNAGPQAMLGGCAAFAAFSAAIDAYMRQPGDE